MTPVLRIAKDATAGLGLPLRGAEAKIFLHAGGDPPM